MKYRKILVDEKLNNIIKEIQNYFCIKTVSETIRLAVNICIWNYSFNSLTDEYSDSIGKIKGTFKTFLGIKKCKISFRISDEILKQAKNIYQTNDPKDKDGITFAISCCLIDFYERIKSAKNNLPPLSSKPLTNGECLFLRPGLKTGDVLKTILDTVEELCTNYGCNTFVEGFAGASNVTLHLSNSKRKIKFEKISLNDGEYDIMNLSSVIQNDVNKLMVLLSCIPRNKNNFNIIKNELVNEPNNLKPGDDIVRATKHYYISCICKGKNRDYNSKRAERPLNLTTLGKISEILKGVVITHKDIFDFLEEILNQEDSLEKMIIYLDPPYIGTEDYYKASENNETDFHEKLRDAIITLKDRGAKIIISYRATVGTSNKATNNSEVQNKLDKLYKDHDFFMQHKKVRNKQIEILLTNVQVSGSVPYDSNIADLIKEHVK